MLVLGWFRYAPPVGKRTSPGEHVSVLRSRERGCFLVVQTVWAEKIQSTTDAGSLNTFGRNEIEVVPISSALLRIACLVILNKTGRVSDQELAADRVSSSNFTVCLFAFENRSSATLDQLGIETPQRVELDVGQRPDPNCLAGHVGLEHRNVVANYPFERSHRFRESSRIPAAETVRV